MCATGVFFLSLFSYNFDGQLRSNFHRFVFLNSYVGTDQVRILVFYNCQICPVSLMRLTYSRHSYISTICLILLPFTYYFYLFVMHVYPFFLHSRSRGQPGLLDLSERQISLQSLWSDLNIQRRQKKFLQPDKLRSLFYLRPNLNNSKRESGVRRFAWCEK